MAGIVRKIGRAVGLPGKFDSEVNDFLGSVDSMSATDEKNMDKRRRGGRGTMSHGGRDLIQIGNRLSQKLRAAGEDALLRKVSNAVFKLGKSRRR